MSVRRNRLLKQCDHNYVCDVPSQTYVARFICHIIAAVFTRGGHHHRDGPDRN
jgi:hypothetical protein